MKHLNRNYDALACDILKAMDIAVLMRLGPKNYSYYGQAPAFYTRLFPRNDDGSQCNRPWDYSPMLEFFIDEAESFFQNNIEPNEILPSGIWLEDMEDGDNLPLSATARILDKEQVILIQAVRDEYAERRRILCKARNDLLERRKINTELNVFKKKAMYDPLTKLYNRGAFHDILQNKISRLQSFSPPLALLMMDIDDFKKINDDFGHLAGDSVLEQIGDLMHNSLRKNDIAVRYGGEEFAIIAPHTTLEQSVMVAEKLRKLCEEHDFQLNRRVTLSIGCTVYHNGEDAREFISRADQALYDAKHAGKNIVRQRVPWVTPLIQDQNFPETF